MLRYSTPTTDVQTDAVCGLLDGGFLQIYDGTIPADGDEPANGALLVELQLGSPAFNASLGGVAWATPIQPAVATNTGEGTWLRMLQADHATVVYDGDVSTSGAVLNLDRTLIQQGANVFVNDFSYSSPKT
jgi:hypothetical protein